MQYEIKRKCEIMNVKVVVVVWINIWNIWLHMIIINDDDYDNPCDESNGNKAKIKEWITKIIKVLLACVVIKTIIEIIKLLTINIMMLTVIIIISNSNLQDTIKMM